jgi:hypothetical protein
MRLEGPDCEILLIKILCDRAVISFVAISAKEKRNRYRIRLQNTLRRKEN